MSNGAELISNERSRQIEQEGWTAEHDDHHNRGEMLDAALSYIYASLNIENGVMPPGKPPSEWPWEAECWKPSTDSVRNLTKAGALIPAVSIDSPSIPHPSCSPRTLACQQH